MIPKKIDNRMEVKEDNSLEKIRNHTSSAYDRLRRVMEEYLESKLRDSRKEVKILDIGCGKNPVLLECIQRVNMRRGVHIDFIDKRYFPSLRIHENGLQRDNVSNMRIDTAHKEGVAKGEYARNGKSFSWRFFRKDFHDFDVPEKDYDFVIANAVIHELLIDSTESKLEFIETFFKKMLDGLSEEGRLLIGGPYYPKYLSSDEVEELFRCHRETTGHADPPNVFVQPEQILKVALLGPSKEEAHFELLYDQEHYYLFDDLDIGRKWYLSILEKVD